MGGDEAATACYEYFHVGCFIAGCSSVYYVKGVVLLWYYRIEMNATFDVSCKSEEAAVQLYEKSLYMEPTFPSAKFLHWR
jgi:hypothetical protein